MTEVRPRWRSKKGSPPKDIDEYLAGLPEPYRAALEDLRRNIKAAVPQAIEAISYGLPTFKQNGGLVAFSATESHCSFHLMSPSVMAAHKKQITEFSTTPATIHFQPDRPLPASLVKRLVRARVAENNRKK